MRPLRAADSTRVATTTTTMDDDRVGDDLTEQEDRDGKREEKSRARNKKPKKVRSVCVVPQRER